MLSGSVASDGIENDGHDGSELDSDQDTSTSSNEGMDQPSLMLSSLNGENGKSYAGAISRVVCAASLEDAFAIHAITPSLVAAGQADALDRSFHR